MEFDVSSELGKDLFDAAVEGNWSTVLQDENLRFIRVNKAAFTDRLQTTKSLNVQIFGWNYQSIFSMLDELESNIEVGLHGLVTVFNLRTEGRRTTTTDDRVTELTYLIEVAGRIKGAFENSQISEQKIDALETLRLNQNTFTYDIRDDLTDLQELGTYLDVGTNLKILRSDQRARLLASIEELRETAGFLSVNLGKVGLKYTVSYDGKTLADALLWDHQNSLVPVWKDFKQSLRRAGSYEEALGHIYVDRLIASYRLSNRGRSGNVVPMLYRYGIYSVFARNPRLSRTKVPKKFRTTRGKEVLTVDVLENQFEWARRHYIVNSEIAKFLGRFRDAATGSGKITIKEYRKFSQSLVKKLDKIANGEGVGPQAAPFMLLDELVRRWLSHPENATVEASDSLNAAHRTALLEVSLYEKNEGDPTERIAISG